MQRHVENDDSGALVKEMARLEETLHHLDLMWTIHDGEEEDDDDDAMDIGNVDDEEEEPVVLPVRRSTHAYASPICFRSPDYISFRHSESANFRQRT